MPSKDSKQLMIYYQNKGRSNKLVKACGRYATLYFLLLLAFASTGNHDTFGTKAGSLNQQLLSKYVSAKPVIGRMLSKRTINMREVPGVTFSSAAPGVNDNVLSQKVNQATVSPGAAPVDTHPHLPSQGSQSASISGTPALTTSFHGLYETICPLKVCPPLDPSPDMALGVSPSWVFQGVNRWFAVYNLSGAIQSGWPKMFQTFFGVPNPSGCNAIPNLFNPRAFYDSNDQRFWAAALNDEHPHGQCTSTYSKIWIAVSQTSNPNGAWNIYSFDLMLGTQNFGDFTQFGFDQHAVYFSADMWTQPQGSGTFEYENTFGINKAAMEAGKNVTPYGFSSFMSQGAQMNSIQPVEAIASYDTGPNAGLFISSYDFKFGGGQCFNGCSGLVIWAIAKPGTPSESLSSIQVSTTSYSKAPFADQPGCTLCLDPLDPAINSTPVWRNGRISFDLTTAVKNGSQTVAGIFWGQINVSLNSSGVLTGASVYQSGYFSFTGDTSALCAAIMPDVNNNLAMVFTESSSSIYPGAYYAVKPASSPLGSFPDGGLAMMRGQAATMQSRWADYSAVSVKGVSNQGVWIASEYENGSQTWSTNIGDVYIGS